MIKGLFLFKVVLDLNNNVFFFCVGGNEVVKVMKE